MEFSYSASLIVIYAAFGLFILVVIGFTSPLVPILPIPILAAYAVGLTLAIGALRKAWAMFGVKILIERNGIHFFKGKKKTTSMPWDIVEDFSFTGSRCIMKVGDKFYYISKELQDFEDFEHIMVDQLTLPIEMRGSNLPKLDMPESMGGVKDMTVDEPQRQVFYGGSQESAEPEEDKLEFFGENPELESAEAERRRMELIEATRIPDLQNGLGRSQQKKYSDEEIIEKYKVEDDNEAEEDIF